MARKVYIKWRDSQTADGWTKRTEITPENLEVESIGFYVTHDLIGVTIAHSVSSDSVNGRLVIPRVCIMEFIWLS